MFLCSLFRAYAYDSPSSQQLVLPNTTQKSHGEWRQGLQHVLSSPQPSACPSSHLFPGAGWQQKALSTPACAWSPPVHQEPNPQCHHLRTPALGKRGLWRTYETSIQKQSEGEKKHYNAAQKRQSPPTLFNVTHYSWILKKEWKPHSPMTFRSWRATVNPFFLTK